MGKFVSLTTRATLTDRPLLLSVAISCIAHASIVLLLADYIFSEHAISGLQSTNQRTIISAHLVSSRNAKKTSLELHEDSLSPQARTGNQVGASHDATAFAHTGYYSPMQVLHPAHVLSAIDIDDGRKHLTTPQATGSATLRIYLSADGRVEQVIIEKNTLPSHILASALLQFRDAAYSPAIIGEQAVKSWMRIEISIKD